MSSPVFSVPIPAISLAYLLILPCLSLSVLSHPSSFLPVFPCPPLFSCLFSLFYIILSPLSCLSFLYPTYSSLLSLCCCLSPSLSVLSFVSLIYSLPSLTPLCLPSLFPLLSPSILCPSYLYSSSLPIFSFVPLSYMFTIFLSYLISLPYLFSPLFTVSHPLPSLPLLLITQTPK